MWKKTLLTLVVLGFAAGCMPADPNFPSQEELYGTEADEYDGFFVRTHQGLLYSAQIDQGGILGMQVVNLGRYHDPDDHAIRGMAFDQRVDLKIEQGRVAGVIDGTLPVDITSEPEGSGLRFRGRMRGYPADFHVDDQKVAGTLGRCSYALTRGEEQKFKGTVRCGELDVPVTVNLPEELFSWKDAELGAALGLLLGGV